MALRDDLVKLRSYIDALIQGLDGLAGAEPPPTPPAPDPQDYLVAARNSVLAGSGDKAGLFGTLVEAPVVTSQELRDLGLLASQADAIIAARDGARAQALALADQIGEAPGSK